MTENSGSSASARYEATAAKVAAAAEGEWEPAVSAADVAKAEETTKGAKFKRLPGGMRRPTFTWTSSGGSFMSRIMQWLLFSIFNTLSSLALGAVTEGLSNLWNKLRHRGDEAKQVGEDSEDAADTCESVCREAEGAIDTALTELESAVDAGLADVAEIDREEDPEAYRAAVGALGRMVDGVGSSLIGICADRDAAIEETLEELIARIDAVSGAPGETTGPGNREPEPGPGNPEPAPDPGPGECVLPVETTPTQPVTPTPPVTPTQPAPPVETVPVTPTQPVTPTPVPTPAPAPGPVDPSQTVVTPAGAPQPAPTIPATHPATATPPMMSQPGMWGGMGWPVNNNQNTQTVNVVVGGEGSVTTRDGGTSTGDRGDVRYERIGSSDAEDTAGRDDLAGGDDGVEEMTPEELTECLGLDSLGALGVGIGAGLMELLGEHWDELAGIFAQPLEGLSIPSCDSIFDTVADAAASIGLDLPCDAAPAEVPVDVAAPVEPAPEPAPEPPVIPAPAPNPEDLPVGEALWHTGADTSAPVPPAAPAPTFPEPTVVTPPPASGAGLRKGGEW